MKHIYILLILMIMTACNKENQAGVTISKIDKSKREKFDFEEYNKRTSFVHKINRKDTLIEMTYIEGSDGSYLITLPKPSFETIYKEFNKEGYITKKEHRVGESTNVGISEYYDEKGNVKKVNEELKFGKIKPIDALKFLEQKGIINLKTGEGQKNQDDNPTFALKFENDGKKRFLITIKEGKHYDGPYGEGEPPSASPVYFYMDGETGKVTEDK